MMRIKVRWGGFLGSPGWSNFYFDTGDDSFLTPEQASPTAGKVAAFFTAVRTKFPANHTFTVQSDAEVLSAATGELLNIHNAGNRAPILGGVVQGAYSGVSGPVVTWRTAGVRNGRRVRGRTFLVPAAANVYQNDGTLEPTHVAEIQTACNNLIAAAEGELKLGIWSRPTAPGASDGEWFPVTSASIPDMAAVLRSRRD